MEVWWRLYSSGDRLYTPYTDVLPSAAYGDKPTSILEGLTANTPYG